MSHSRWWDNFKSIRVNLSLRNLFREIWIQLRHRIIIIQFMNRRQWCHRLKMNYLLEVLNRIVLRKNFWITYCVTYYHKKRLELCRMFWHVSVFLILLFYWAAFVRSKLLDWSKFTETCWKSILERRIHLFIHFLAESTRNIGTKWGYRRQYHVPSSIWPDQNFRFGSVFSTGCIFDYKFFCLLVIMNLKLKKKSRKQNLSHNYQCEGWPWLKPNSLIDFI